MNTENPMNLTLTHGSHKSPEKGMCLMEAVAWLAGESHSDRPECACPVISSFGRTLNDNMGVGPEGDALRAKHLLPLATKLIGTRSTPEVERKRALFFADRAIRLFAPKALEAAGFTEEADALRALPEIVDAQTAHAARAAAYAAAADAAAAARAAARDAARAARAAAYAAASAARDAARAAARAAARDAALADAATADAAYAAAAAAWAARAVVAAADNWEQAAQVLAEACEINLEGENR